MADKRCTEDDVVAELRDGMTIGIGGWGSRRKPMSIVRAILRSDLRDLTIVAYGGPDVGMLCAAGKARRVVYGFVSLDSIPLEPHFRVARQQGTIEAMELDGNSCAETSVAFLQQLRANHSEPLIIIWDNGPAHGGDALRAYLATLDLRLRLVRLPAYSPDFNPDEAVWGWIREEVEAAAA